MESPPLDGYGHGSGNGSGLSADSRQSRDTSSNGQQWEHQQSEQPGYDDGYTGDTPVRGDLNFAAAQQTSFRPQDSEPGALADGDDDDRYPDNNYRVSGGTSGGSSEPEPSAKRYSGAAALSDNDDDDDRFVNSGYRADSGVSRENGNRGSGYSSYSNSASAAQGSSYGDEADEFHDAGPEHRADGASEPAYQSLSSAPSGPVAPAARLTIEAKRDLLGKLGEYSATDADGAYNGVLGPEHPAYRHYHLGLSFGIGPFNQERGDLGRLLEAMKQRDGAKFAEIFGQDADALLQTTNAAGPPSAGSADGRSARLQKVGGADLWEEPWLGRFREAAAHKPFQAAQNQVAAALFLDPMLLFARWMGLTTERALALLVDRAADLGVTPAQEWIANSAGPLQTAPQRHATLAALGFDSLRAFQNAHPGTETNGQWGPLTHAAAIAKLRRSGTSPLPLPTADQMLDALVRRSARTPGFHRVRALRNDARFADTPFQLEQEKL